LHRLIYIVIFLLIFSPSKLFSDQNQLSAQCEKESKKITQNIEYVAKYEISGFSIKAPKGWNFILPSEMRKKTKGALEIGPKVILFIVHVNGRLKLSHFGS